MSIKRFLKSSLCIFLFILMLLSAVLLPVRVDAVSQEDIDKLQDELESLEKQREAQAELVDQLTANKALIIDRKAALDMQITTNREEVALLEEELSMYEDMLLEKEQQLANAQAAEDYQHEMLRSRMRAMEENGQLGYYAYLFDATNLSDMLSRVADVSDIMHYDSHLEQNLTEARAQVEANAAELQQIVSERDAIRLELDNRQKELDAKQEAACNLIANLDALSENAQEEYEAIYKAEEEALQQQLEAIAALSAQHAAAVQAYVNASNTNASQSSATEQSPAPTVDLASLVSSGNLVWPLDSTYITSTYGYRVSPTAGASSNHQAIDIDGVTGDNIYAASNGTVIAATYNNGLGYYVTIQHDDGTITSRYSHMSQMTVNVGDTVAAGQVIGYVGASGIATGDHLDYAIYVNGQAVDPLSFYDSSYLSYDPTA